MSLVLKKLNEFADVISGYAFKSEWFGEGDSKVIRIGDLSNGKISIEDTVTIDGTKHKISENFKIKENDILMALSGATVGKIAIARHKDVGAYINQRVAIIRAKDINTAQYLKFFFDGVFLEKLLMNAGGAAQPNLSPKQLSLMEIPLPSLEEQHRIALILDKADAIRQKRQQAIAKLDELLQATFIDMFGDPIKNEKGWSIGTIGDMLESVKYGSSDKAELEGEVPILRMNNITYSGEMNLKDLKYIKQEQADEKYLVHQGDILFNRTNSKELVGKTAVYYGPEPMAYAGYLVRGRTLPEHIPEYISGFLNSSWGKSTLQSMCKSIIGMANINAKEFQSISLPIPPSELQLQFKKKVYAIREHKLKLKIQLHQYDELFNALQQKAFNGTL